MELRNLTLDDLPLDEAIHRAADERPAERTAEG